MVKILGKGKTFWDLNPRAKVDSSNHTRAGTDKKYFIQVVTKTSKENRCETKCASPKADTKYKTFPRDDGKKPVAKGNVPVDPPPSRNPIKTENGFKFPFFSPNKDQYSRPKHHSVPKYSVSTKRDNYEYEDALMADATADLLYECKQRDIRKMRERESESRRIDEIIRENREYESRQQKKFHNIPDKSHQVHQDLSDLSRKRREEYENFDPDHFNPEGPETGEFMNMPRFPYEIFGGKPSAKKKDKTQLPEFMKEAMGYPTSQSRKSDQTGTPKANSDSATSKSNPKNDFHGTKGSNGNTSNANANDQEPRNESKHNERTSFGDSNTTRRTTETPSSNQRTSTSTASRINSNPTASSSTTNPNNSRNDESNQEIADALIQRGDRLLSDIQQRLRPRYQGPIDLTNVPQDWIPFSNSQLESLQNFLLKPDISATLDQLSSIVRAKAPLVIGSHSALPGINNSHEIPESFLQYFWPFSIRGDGSCFYNSVSHALNGDYALTSALRLLSLRTALMDPDVEASFLAHNQAMDSYYFDLSRSVHAILYSWADEISEALVSSVIGRPIYIYLPFKGSCFNTQPHTLNNMFENLEESVNNHRILTGTTDCMGREPIRLRHAENNTHYEVYHKRQRLPLEFRPFQQGYSSIIQTEEPIAINPHSLSTTSVNEHSIPSSTASERSYPTQESIANEEIPANVKTTFTIHDFTKKHYDSEEILKMNRRDKSKVKSSPIKQFVQHVFCNKNQHNESKSASPEKVLSSPVKRFLDNVLSSPKKLFSFKHPSNKSSARKLNFEAVPKSTPNEHICCGCSKNFEKRKNSLRRISEENKESVKSFFHLEEVETQRICNACSLKVLKNCGKSEKVTSHASDSNTSERSCIGCTRTNIKQNLYLRPLRQDKSYLDALSEAFPNVSSNLFDAESRICEKCHLGVVRRQRKARTLSSEANVPAPDHQNDFSTPVTSKRFSTGTDYTLPIPSVPTLPGRCFVCGDTSSRAKVPSSVVASTWLKMNLVVPFESKCCPSHLTTEGTELNDLAREILHERMLNETTGISTESLVSLLESVSKLHLAEPKPYIKFTKEMSNDDYVCFTGLKKYHFEDLLNYIKPHIKPSHVRSAEDALGMFLMKMRQRPSNEFIGRLFGCSESTVGYNCNKILKLLDKNFVPGYLGFNHISREEYIKQHVTKSSKILFGVPDDTAIMIMDATYLYHQKSSSFAAQRDSYSMHKFRNLVKPMMVIAPDGYILECFGTYKAKINDATILKHMLNTNSGLVKFRKNGDVLVLDRGFRDAVKKSTEYGFDVRSPHFLPKGQKQHTDIQANQSRLITKVRWAIEAVNGRTKRTFRFLFDTIENTYLPNMNTYMRVCCALLNAYHDPVIVDSPDDENNAREMVEDSKKPNELLKYLQDNKLLNKRAIWKSLTDESLELDDFPRLSMDEIKKLTKGVYQIRLAKSYNAEHMAKSGKYIIDVSKEEPDLLRARIKSRHSGHEIHQLWIRYDGQKTGPSSIPKWYCNCKNGARTNGCCAHITSVIVRLSYARHQGVAENPGSKQHEAMMDADEISECDITTDTSSSDWDDDSTELDNDNIYFE